MATPVKYYSYIEYLHEKAFHWGTDDWRWVLTNSAVVLTNTQLSDLTQIANGNGYTTGGTAMTILSSSQTMGLYTLTASDVVFTGSGAGMATFQSAHLYSNTSTNDFLVCGIDYGRGIVLGSGQPHTIDIDAVLGLFSAV